MSPHHLNVLDTFKSVLAFKGVSSLLERQLCSSVQDGASARSAYLPVSKRKSIFDHRIDVLFLIVIWRACETGLVKGVHFEIPEDWTSNAELGMAGVTR